MTASSDATLPQFGSPPPGKLPSLFMIAERRDSKTPSTPSTFARLKSITCLTQQDEDMFGNIFLHHAFASGSPDIIIIQKSLKDAPDGAKIKNQFGRIPLHYALDRTKVNMECFYLLLKIYPQGAVQVDDQGSTPYDLSLRWNHSNAILKALLDADPTQDKPQYMKLRWGPLHSIASYFAEPSTRRKGGVFPPKPGKIAASCAGNANETPPVSPSGSKDTAKTGNINNRVAAAFDGPEDLDVRVFVSEYDEDQKDYEECEEGKEEHNNAHANANANNNHVEVENDLESVGTVDFHGKY